MIRPPLPPGCIFREDFRSPKLAADNGLVVTGNPWRARGVRPDTGVLIKANRIVRVKSCTIVMHMAPRNRLGFDIALALRNGAAGITAAFSGSSIYMDTANSGGGTTLLPYAQSPEAWFAWTTDGSNCSFYLNGAALGTLAFSSPALTMTATQLFIGTGQSGNNPLQRDLFEVLVYSSILSADEIRQDYLLRRGLQA